MFAIFYKLVSSVGNMLFPYASTLETKIGCIFLHGLIDYLATEVNVIAVVVHYNDGMFPLVVFLRLTLINEEVVGI